MDAGARGVALVKDGAVGAQDFHFGKADGPVDDVAAERTGDELHAVEVLFAAVRRGLGGFVAIVWHGL